LSSKKKAIQKQYRASLSKSNRIKFDKFLETLYEDPPKRSQKSTKSHLKIIRTNIAPIRKIYNESNSLKVYTDGGCYPNPGTGGWAYVIVEDDKIIYRGSGGSYDVTNNIMEMMAAYEALHRIKELFGIDRSIEIISDSSYLVYGMNSWVDSWKTKDWKKKMGEDGIEHSPIKNVDLWQSLDNIRNEFPLKWTWIRGHSGNKFNEICDEMASFEIDKLQKTTDN